MRLFDTVMSLLYASGESMHRFLWGFNHQLMSRLVLVVACTRSDAVRFAQCGFVNVRGINLCVFMYATNRMCDARLPQVTSFSM